MVAARDERGSRATAQGRRVEAVVSQPLGGESVQRGTGDPPPNIAGFFTLATGQVDFSDLPTDLARHLPRRTLPVAILAWLGVSKTHQRRSEEHTSELQ